MQRGSPASHLATCMAYVNVLCMFLLEINKNIVQKKNKAPGSDGLTGDFYRHFWEDIKKLLHQVFLEIFETCILPTMRYGLIISIPKPGKDPRFIENRRPITLRNSDYKLLTYIFSTCLKTGISKLIAETQSGFLKGRSIHNNIRLVMDIIEYRNQIEDDGFLFFLDSYTAFD